MYGLICLWTHLPDLSPGHTTRQQDPTLSLCLSIRFNGHFPGEPGLAGTGMSPFLNSLKLRMMEVLVTSGAVRRAKLQSNRHRQQTNTQLFASRMAFLLLNQQRQSTEGEIVSHSTHLLTQSHLRSLVLDR